MTRYLIANWKMNLPPEGVEGWIAAAGGADPRDTTLVVAPPFPYLRGCCSEAGGIAVAGQNCSDHPSGAFTGEVSAAMLRQCGASYVILGHSERRTLFGETDAWIARKLQIAIGNGLVPVLCIGEDLAVRDAGQVAPFLARQIEAAAAAVGAAGEIVIAYEPIWAIGTGRNASGAMVAETLAAVRDAVARSWPAGLARTPLLYGGSVTPDNVEDLARNGTIDGFLVGGASLDSRKFLAIHAGMR